MTSTDRPAVIAARDLSKNYGHVQALQPSTFVVADGEFFTLLGPSGCGKTTLLRLIAGFEAPSSGELILKGEDIATLPPNRRPINTVFQQYALFPHMTVADNIAFGPRMLSWDAGRVQARVLEMLEMIQLTEFAQRLPSQLSGGQQQRVALARAMAAEPALLLLDEPLSALDLKLRQAMRIELKRLQQASGISFIFVTHDQEEALALSDRIAVMSNGVIQQVGTAEEIYERPSNAFVADFIGESNVLDVELERLGGQCVVRLPGDAEAIICATDQQPDTATGQLSIRPERISITDAGNAHWRGSVVSGVYLGMDSQWQVQLEAGPVVTVRRRGGEALTVGDTVGLRVDDGAARLLNA